MESKNRLQELAGIINNKNYSFLLSYDITEKDKEIRPDIKIIIDRYSGEPINESLYGFNNIELQDLREDILLLKDEIEKEFSNATNFNLLTSNLTTILIINVR